MNGCGNQYKVDKHPLMKMSGSKADNITRTPRWLIVRSEKKNARISGRQTEKARFCAWCLKQSDDNRKRRCLYQNMIAEVMRQMPKKLQLWSSPTAEKDVIRIPMNSSCFYSMLTIPSGKRFLPDCSSIMASCTIVSSRCVSGLSIRDSCGFDKQMRKMEIDARTSTGSANITLILIWFQEHFMQVQGLQDECYGCKNPLLLSVLHAR